MRASTFAGASRKVEAVSAVDLPAQRVPGIPSECCATAGDSGFIDALRHPHRALDLAIRTCVALLMTAAALITIIMAESWLATPIADATAFQVLATF